MNTPPPPYAYPAPGQTAASNRATARAQRRAAQAKARWQRDQDRLRLRAMQRRSVAGPVLLVALGVVLLLIQAGRLPWSSVLVWLSVWWPSILIGTGVVMLLEWLIDRQLSLSSVPPPRRMLGGAAATFLVMLALAGAILMTARRSASWVQGSPWDLDHAWGQQADSWGEHLNRQLAGNGTDAWQHLFGVHSDATSDLQQSLAPKGELTIEDPNGNVVVTGASEDGQVHVAVHQHLFSWQHDNLNSERQREQPRFKGDREHLVFIAFAQGQDDADLTVQMPHEASVVIHSRKGDVSIEELHGSATVAAHGDVKLTAIRGSVTLNTDNDDATITAHSLGGGITLNGRSGDIALSDIEGGLTLHGDFFGTTQLERVRGPVNFQSSFTHLVCAGIPGSLTVEGRSDLTGHHLLGPLTIATSDRDLSLDGIRGASTITDRNGSVTLNLASPLQPLHVTNVNGTVDVSVPERQAFTLHARTHDAQVENDFGLSSVQANGVSSTDGTVLGDGPTLELQTTGDDIRLHKIAGQSSDKWDDGTASQQLAPVMKRPKQHTRAD